MKLNERTLVSLQEYALWFHKVDVYNDPYEMWCIFENAIPNPFSEREEFILFISEHGNYTREQAINFLNTEPEEKLIEYYQTAINSATIPLNNQRDETRDKTLISCFSKKEDILIMWAHYADGLQGICIEYDEKVMKLDEENIDPGLHIFPVNYLSEDEFNVLNLKKVVNGESDFFKEFFLTKSHHWKYEQEVRILRTIKDSDVLINGRSQKLVLNKKSITSIIIGEKANPSLKSIVKQIFKDTHVAIKTASMSESEYKIDIELDSA
jgi:hypothetical protein